MLFFVFGEKTTVWGKKRGMIRMKKILNILSTINKIPTHLYVGELAIGLLLIMILSTIMYTGLIQIIYAFLFILVLAYGLATAWHIYHANETKFLNAWSIFMASYWIPTLIAMQFNGTFLITLSVLACMIVGGIPIIFICKQS